MAKPTYAVRSRPHFRGCFPQGPKQMSKQSQTVSGSPVVGVAPPLRVTLNGRTGTPDDLIGHAVMYLAWLKAVRGEA